MQDNYYAVIMAGGGGTRLWPLSRQNRPKQILNLFDHRSLFQISINRVKKLFQPDHIYVVTIQEQVEILQQQAPELPPDNFLVEPFPRGTASVVGLAAISLKEKDPNAVMAVLTADHYIKNEDKFIRLLKGAYAVAQDNHLVTLGIQPTYPATGYGYILQGTRLNEYPNYEIYEVEKFIEKPHPTRAIKFFQEGNYSWNSGMFMWKVDVILDEVRKQMPHLHNQLLKIQDAWKTDDLHHITKDVWGELELETIDYGIMEDAENVVVISGDDLGWTDIGSWESMDTIVPADENDNIILSGKHFTLDSRGCVIHTTDKSKLVVTLGVSDMIIVDTGDVILISPKAKAQKIRDLVTRLKDEGYDYL